VAGYTIHENNWGMAPNIVVSDADGAPLWSGPVPLTDTASGFPFGAMVVPGRDVGLQFLLQRAEDGTGLLLVLPYRVVGFRDDGSPIADVGEMRPMLLEAGDARTTPGIDFSVGLTGFNQFVVLIVKRDPGLPFVWAAFGLLIAGLLITFHMPRRRIWARRARDGSVALVARSDRYVDQDREFGRLIDDVVAARAGAPAGTA
jgi:cytochrome c biogenesis protein